MRVALFGGTFNPVHNGHLLIAEAARESHKLDRVLFVPAGLPPHKKPPKTSVKDRMAMLKRAIQGNSHFQVSNWEIRQKRVVYTVQTLKHFRREHPRDQFFFIIGSDSLADLPRWHQSKRLQSMCKFITMDRIKPFASHDIRRRVSKRESIRYQVPDSVERYIRSHRLYLKPE